MSSPVKPAAQPKKVRSESPLRLLENLSDFAPDSTSCAWCSCCAIFSVMCFLCPGKSCLSGKCLILCLCSRFSGCVVQAQVSTVSWPTALRTRLLRTSRRGQGTYSFSSTHAEATSMSMWRRQTALLLPLLLCGITGESRLQPSYSHFLPTRLQTSCSQMHTA
jgi:hypothetical protein